MAMTTSVWSVAETGETAGAIWRLLAENGRTSLSALIKQVDAPREQVLLAVGWLAREDKLVFSEDKRGRWLALRPEEFAGRENGL